MIDNMRVEFERLLVADILNDASVAPLACAVARPEDFSDARARVVYEAAHALLGRRELADKMGIFTELAARGTLATAGGYAGVIELAGLVVTSVQVREHAKRVCEYGQLASLQNLCARLGQDAASLTPGGTAVVEMLQHAHEALTEVSERLVTQEPIRVAAADPQLMQDIANGLPTKEGVLSGFLDIDVLTHGFRKGELTLLAARPSIGKSLLAANVAEQIAERDPSQGVLFVSMEMSPSAIMQRAMFARAGVERNRLYKYGPTTDERDRLLTAQQELAALPWFVHYQARMTALDIEAIARRWRRRHPLALIVIDYLGLMHARGETRVEVVSEISRSLKALAIELDLPVLALSQLNRKSEDKTDRKPAMSELRDSGSLEQDADVVWLLHREDFYLPPEKRTGHAMVGIAKNRNGPTDGVKIHFDEKRVAFRNAVAKVENFS